MPEHVLFDNLKAVVIERDAYGAGKHRWNNELNTLAEECGFAAKLCQPYRAQTKGKVERFNAYLKGSFVVPLAATVEASGLKLDVAMTNLLQRDFTAKARGFNVAEGLACYPASNKAVRVPGQD